MDDLKEKAAKGTKWSFIYSSYSAVLGPITMVLLARFLSPTDFGYISIITIFTTISIAMARMGFSKAIIQKENVTKNDLDTIFWFEQLLGITIFIIIFISSNFIAAYFRIGELVYLIRVASFSVLFEPIDLVFRSILKKELYLNFYNKARMIRLTSKNLSAIILAYSGFGALSYAIGHLIGIFALTIILFIYFYTKSFWLPSMYFSFKNLKPYLAFGIYVVGRSFTTQLILKLDEIIIGRYLGAESLGFYHFGKRNISYIGKLITKPINLVAFPLLSKLKNNSQKFENTYFQIFKMIFSISAPAHIGLAMTSMYWIPLFFGNEWLPALNVTIIICIWSLLRRQYNSLFPATLYSIGNSKLIFKLAVIELPIKSILLLFASQYNIEMVAITLIFISLVKLIYFNFILAKTFKTSVLKKLGFNIKYLILNLLIMSAAIYLWFQLTSFFNLSNFLILFFTILLGIIVYVLSLFYLERDYFYYLVRLAKKSF